MNIGSPRTSSAVIHKIRGWGPGGPFGPSAPGRGARPGAISPELYRGGGRGQAAPGYAVVRHERDIALNRGRNSVRFTDVAAFIDPTTVMFASLTDPAGTSVVEQNFQFDLVSQEKLLQKYIDQTIRVDQVRGQSVETFSGTLLSTAGGMILKRDDGSRQQRAAE